MLYEDALTNTGLQIISNNLDFFFHSSDSKNIMHSQTCRWKIKILLAFVFRWMYGMHLFFPENYSESPQKGGFNSKKDSTDDIPS